MWLLKWKYYKFQIESDSKMLSIFESAANNVSYTVGKEEADAFITLQVKIHIIIPHKPYMLLIDYKC